MNEGETAAGLSRRAAALGGAIGAAGIALGELAAAAGVTLGGATPVAAADTATPTTDADEVPPDFRVVLHAADSQRWPFVISNLRNLAKEWPLAPIRIVVDGDAVYNLGGASNEVAELAKHMGGIRELLVCPNALKEHQISTDQLPAFAEVRGGGVVELVIANRDGYVYVRP